MNISIFKYLISILLLLFSTKAFASTYASLSPVPTGIIYDLNAQDNLVAISANCKKFSIDKSRPVIGDNYFVNAEMLVKLHPDYIFAMKSAQPMLSEIALTKTKPVYFDFTSVEDIYEGIRTVAKYTNREENAEKLISDISKKIEKYKTNNPKRILYIVQNEPLITVGKGSYINDIIEKSGHTSVTANINYPYPVITLEYILKTRPDVIIITFNIGTEKIKKLFPNTPVLYLSSEQRDIINSPNGKVYEAVKLFSELNFLKEPEDFK